MKPMAQHVAILARNLQGHHEANVVIDPTTGASLEYRNLVKGPTKSICGDSFANEIGRLAQGVGTMMPSVKKNHILHLQGEITSR